LAREILKTDESILSDKFEIFKKVLMFLALWCFKDFSGSNFRRAKTVSVIIKTGIKEN